MESPSTPAPLAATYTPKILTGIDAVDRTWGGFYRGGSYLVYGRAQSGRDLFTMRFTQVGVQMNESVLFLSPARPKDLMIQAASIGFNLREAYAGGLVKLLRIPPVLNQRTSDDSGILKSMRDLVAIIRREKPQRLVLSDFMPFVMFRSFDRFRSAFVEMLEHTDVLDMTMVLVMSEPANSESERMIAFMNSQMTGSVHVQTPGEREDLHHKRRLTLMPNIGHLRRTSEEMWDLAPFVEEEQRLSSGPRVLPQARGASSQPAEPAYRPIRLSGPQPGSDAAAEPGADPNAAGGLRLGGARTTPPSTAGEIPRVPTVLDEDASAQRASEDRRAEEDERRQNELRQQDEQRRQDEQRWQDERRQAELREAQRREDERRARLEREREEADRREAQRREDERLAAQRQEEQRREDERRQRAEQERQEAERREAERLEAERREAQRREAERLETERREAERREALRREEERRREEAERRQREEVERREAEQRRIEEDRLRRQRERFADPAATPATPPRNRSERGAEPSRPLSDAPPRPRYVPPTEPQLARTPEPAASESQPVRTEAHYDRARFAERLERRFARRESDRPFLLVAMRMDPQASEQSGPFDFDTVSDLVASTIRSDDTLFIDTDDERLVVFLDDTRDDQKQAFFERLKERLNAEVPHKADHLLHAVSAVTLPNGQPFGTAQECLAYMLS